jgi:hypothetical protein
MSLLINQSNVPEAVSEIIITWEYPLNCPFKWFITTWHSLQHNSRPFMILVKVFRNSLTFSKHNNRSFVIHKQTFHSSKGVYFRFGSVFIKKSNQIEFFFKKNRNRTKTGSNRPVSVRFNFLEKKPVQTGLARFFPVWLGFFGSVRFGFSGSRLKKPKPNLSVFSKF